MSRASALGLYWADLSTFAQRRAARASWPIRAVALGHEELVDGRDTTTVDERLALVWTLTRELWAFTGRPIPDYARSEMPGRVVRLDGT
jgi:hypothetical protein